MPRYIDADALMNELRSMVMYVNDGAVDCGSYNTAIIDAKAAISSAPTISPDEARGEGKWIKNCDRVKWWYECSCCHEKPLISRFGDTEILSAYCPNCGARLEVTSDA